MKFPTTNTDVLAKAKTQNPSKRLKTRIGRFLKLVVRQTVTRPDSWIGTKIERKAPVSTTESTFLQLPIEVRCNIYDFCNRKSLCAMATSCKQIYYEINPGIEKGEINSSYSPWNTLRFRSFPDAEADTTNNTGRTAMSVYREAENEELKVVREAARTSRQDAMLAIQDTCIVKLKLSELSARPIVDDQVQQVDDWVQQKKAAAKKSKKELQEAINLLNDM